MTLQKSDKPFCYAPWIGMLHANTMEGTMPCCEWKGKRFQGSIKEYQDSNYLNKIKKKMLEHDYSFLTKTCEECIVTEKFKGQSRRARYNRYIARGFYNTTELQEFDYRPSNLCNLKCRMCNSFASSLIAKEQSVTIDQYLIKDDWKNIDLTKLQNISIVGGEPSIIDEVYDFLEYCIKLGLNETCHVSMMTNATNINPRWQNIIKQWKSISFEISLDGTGKTFDYIRAGGNWNTIEKNCLWYEDNFKKVSYHITALAYNIPNLEDWLDWFIPRKSEIYPVFGEEHLSLNAVPTEILQDKLKYLKNYNTNLTESIKLMIKNAAFNKDLLEKLRRKTAELENKRKGCIHDVNPIYKYI